MVGTEPVSEVPDFRVPDCSAASPTVQIPEAPRDEKSGAETQSHLCVVPNNDIADIMIVKIEYGADADNCGALLTQ
jgi:hypothetical protein